MKDSGTLIDSAIVKYLTVVEKLLHVFKQPSDA